MGKANKFCTTARQALPLEPILFPKLRNHFADFPYLRCPIGQRLLTSETCCGYQYGQVRRLAFMKRALASSGFSRAHRSVPDTTESRGAQPAFQPPLWVNQFRGVEDPVPRTLAGPKTRVLCSRQGPKTLAETPMDVSGLVRVAARDLHHGLGILTQFPFDAGAIFRP